VKRRLAILALAGLTLTGLTGPKPVVVASKPFGESYLLAEMFAQLLEAHGFAVERKLGLGATELAFQALRTDAIDLYPEYTGTGLTAILHESPSADPREAFSRVATEFSRRWGIRWLPPLGFENTYAIAVRKETAERLHLRTLSDLTKGDAHGFRRSRTWALGLPATFAETLAARSIHGFDGRQEIRPSTGVPVTILRAGRPGPWTYDV